MVESLHIHCVFAPSITLHSVSGQDRALVLIRKTLRAPYFKPDDATLLAMAPLPDNCAQRIARAFDYLERVRLQVEGLPTGLLNEVTSASERKWLFEKWASDLSNAQELFTVAIRVCNVATDIGAPMPTHEERYGHDIDVEFG
jgi:hypothetical protein